ncbi:MAG: GNAT family N-acetyltransferase [Pseudomonadales bacterium]
MFAYGIPYGKLRLASNYSACCLMDTVDQSNRVLSTTRLVIQPIQSADEERLLRLWRDPEVRRYLWDNHIISEDEVKAIQQGSDRCFAEYGAGLYGIAAVDQPNDLVGFCGLRKFEQGELLELLYGMYPQYWGKGLVTEAVKAVLTHGFEQCGIERVIAATETPNQPSVRVMQRLGMAFSERRQWHGLDTVFYTLTREDFHAV